MKFDILTIFPDIIHDYSEKSILGRAQKAGKIEIRAVNFRDFTSDKFHRVDDTPYGGGPGMVLQVEPIFKALKSINAFPPFQGGTQRGLPSIAERGRKGRQPPAAPLSKGGGRFALAKTKIIILDPAGKKFDQKMAERFSKLDRLVLICGRYEGFDDRIYKFADEKVSVGDYVLSGGELPALTVVEATARLIPGVLGNVESLRDETHNRVHSTQCAVHRGKRELRTADCEPRTVEPPQYTRPENFMGMKVPKVLLSGDHEKIAEWRNKKSIKS